MSDPARAWAPRGPWAGLLPQGEFGVAGAAGVTVTPCDGFGLASLIASQDGEAALAAGLRERFGLALPPPSRALRSHSHTLIGTGPGQWLLVAETRMGFADDLAALAGVAAVADQSDSRAALRLSGPRVREALAKGCMVDLHPAAFPPGAAAATSLAHIGVQLWRAADLPNGEAAFDILVPRSMAASFWSWFSASAAEFGGIVLPGAAA